MSHIWHELRSYAVASLLAGMNEKRVPHSRNFLLWFNSSTVLGLSDPNLTSSIRMVQ
jgi:hypothetical protein